jgi:hypothetical protein
MMAAFAPIALGGLIGGQLLKKAFKKPAAATPTPVYAQPTMTPRANSVVADILSARRGSSANMRTGSAGAESTTGKKSLLGQ